MPVLDLSDTLGDVIIRLSDVAPSADELDGGILFQAEPGNRHLRKNLEKDSNVLVEEEGLVIVISSVDQTIFLSLDQEASAMLSTIAGVEILPGLYVTVGGFEGGYGPCLIYGITKGT